MPTKPSLSVIAGDLARPKGNARQRARNHRSSTTAAWNDQAVDEQHTGESDAAQAARHVSNHAKEVEALRTKAIEQRARNRAAAEARARRDASRKPTEERGPYLERRLRRIGERYDHMEGLYARWWEEERGGLSLPGITHPDGTVTRAFESLKGKPGWYFGFRHWNSTRADPSCQVSLLDATGHILVNCQIIGDPALQEVVLAALYGVDVPEGKPEARAGAVVHLVK